MLNHLIRLQNRFDEVCAIVKDADDIVQSQEMCDRNTIDKIMGDFDHTVYCGLARYELYGDDVTNVIDFVLNDRYY